MHIIYIMESNTTTEVTKYMDQDKREKGRQKKEQEKFNNVTNSNKPENQNQNYNVRKEGVGRQNNKYRDE